MASNSALFQRDAGQGIKKNWKNLTCNNGCAACIVSTTVLTHTLDGGNLKAAGKRRWCSNKTASPRLWWSFRLDGRLSPAVAQWERLRGSRGAERGTKERSCPNSTDKQHTSSTPAPSKQHQGPRLQPHEDLLQSDFPAALLICSWCRANWMYRIGADNKVFAARVHPCIWVAKCHSYSHSLWGISHQL